MSSPSINPSFPFTPKLAAQSFSSTDTTSKKDILTPGTAGTRIFDITITSNDSADRNLAFYLNDGTTDWYIGNVLVPLGSGYTTVARVEALNTIGEPGFGWLDVAAGWKLRANLVVTMTSSDIITIVCNGQDF